MKRIRIADDRIESLLDLKDRLIGWIGVTGDVAPVARWTAEIVALELERR